MIYVLAVCAILIWIAGMIDMFEKRLKQTDDMFKNRPKQNAVEPKPEQDLTSCN